MKFLGNSTLSTIAIIVGCLSTLVLTVCLLLLYSISISVNNVSSLYTTALNPNLNDEDRAHVVNRSEIHISYPKYYYYEDLSSTKYFEACRHEWPWWPKSMCAHYFMDQLKSNKYNTRVYECDKADIFVIPMSLDYGFRGFCHQNLSKSARDELHQVISSLNTELFTSNQSCWNQYPQSRTKHIVLYGSVKGRKEILQTGTKSHLYRNWSQSFLGIDTSVTHSAFKRCVVSMGHVSIVSQRQMFVLSQANKSDPSDIFYANNDYIEPWLNRSYDFFFIGQANDKHGYENRKRLLRDFNETFGANGRNIFVQTDTYKTMKVKYPRCDLGGEATDKMTGDRFFALNKYNMPCSMDYGALPLYVDLLPQSKFNLMMRGQDPCSSRFYDALAFNVINIVVSDRFHNCLIGLQKGHKPIIPWKDMFIQISEHAFASNPRKAISEAVSQYSTEYFENMLRLVQMYKKYILWDAKDSEVANVVLYTAINTCDGV